MKWRDKRDVAILSTRHKGTLSLTGRQQRDGQPVVKPTAILDYNKFMGGVDLLDQLAKSYTPLRKTVKWWKKLFLHLVNLAVVNAYVVWKASGPRKLTHHQFRLEVVKSWLEDAPNLPGPPPKGRRANGPVVRRLRERHFPSRIMPQPGALKQNPTRACHACNQPAGKRHQPGDRRRKETRFECGSCKKALCIDPCFEHFHTRKYFRPNAAADAYTGSDLEGSQPLEE
jgi:hypothetical protein